MRLIRVISALAALAAVSACAATESSAPPAISVATTASTPTVTAPPPSPAPVAVDDAVSAPSPAVVHFAHGKADITGSTMQVLWGLAPALKAADPAVIRVAGFTDSSGKAAYNRLLAEKRAAVVADQLRKLGVTAKIEVVSGGIVKAGKKGVKDAAARKVEISWEAGPKAASAAPLTSDQTVASASDAPAKALGSTAALTSADPVAASAVFAGETHEARSLEVAVWVAIPEATGPPQIFC